MSTEKLRTKHVTRSGRTVFSRADVRILAEMQATINEMRDTLSQLIKLSRRGVKS